jgi:hypothetical protein
MSYPLQRARVLLWHAIGRKEWTNVLHFELTGAFSGSFDIQAACASVDAHFKTAWIAPLGGDYVWLGPDISVYNVGVTSNASVYDSDPGTQSDPALPNEVAALVRLQSATGGASGRGRVYVGGLTSTLVSDGRLSATAITFMNAIAAVLRSSISIQGQTWVPSIQSKTANAYYHVVTSVSEVNVGTQRRRRPRR